MRHPQVATMGFQLMSHTIKVNHTMSTSAQVESGIRWLPQALCNGFGLVGAGIRLSARGFDVIESSHIL